MGREDRELMVESWCQWSEIQMEVKENVLRGISGCLWKGTPEGGENSPLPSAAEEVVDLRGEDGLQSRQELKQAVLKDIRATTQSLFALGLVVRRWF